tara:strand:+ start:75590 stop:76195 length:606 start_codon:yes stop_codon:yes gene_type:complete
MAPAVKCPSCGAQAKKGEGRFCSHCGGSFPDVPRITPDEWATHPERFDEAEASDWAKRASAIPAPSVSIAAVLVPLIFLGAWVAMGSFMYSQAGGADFFRYGVIAITGLGTIGLLVAISRAIRMMQAPIKRQIAVVVDERVNVRGGGNDSSASTHYYVTVVGRDGTRIECETTDTVAGLVTAGDIGVAVMRMQTLVAFHRA